MGVCGCVGGSGGRVVHVCVLFRSPEFGEDSSGVACPISAIQFSVLFLGGILGFDFHQRESLVRKCLRIPKVRSFVYLKQKFG